MIYVLGDKKWDNKAGLYQHLWTDQIIRSDIQPRDLALDINSVMFSSIYITRGSRGLCPPPYSSSGGVYWSSLVTKYMLD